jgi:hypothetical protein
MDVNIAHPAGHDESGVWLESLRVSITDSMGVPLDPHELFDRIGVRLGDGQITYESSITMEAGYTVFPAGPAGLYIGPGQSESIAMIADVEPDTPYDNMKLWMYPENGLELRDATDRKRELAVTQQTGCGDGFPFATDGISIFLPAGAPRLKAEALPTQLGYPGQPDLTALLGDLTYAGAGPRADLVAGRWVGEALRRTSGGLATVPAGDVFSAVRLIIDDETVAADTLFAGGGILLQPEGEYVISRGDVKSIRLACDIRKQAATGNYVIGLNDSTFAEFTDRSLLTYIYPVLVGSGYPFLTADLSITGASLANSFTNWPNPFNPNHQTTTIGYVLKEQADVDIEVFTLTGDLVRRVASGSYRPAGANALDLWDGRNDSGDTVIPGTYLCRVTARYASGGSEAARRLVAVVR